MAGSRIAVLTPARNAARDLPGFFASVENFADFVVALDDGSTDDTWKILRSAPIVAEVLTNPRRDTYAGWDDAENRRRLLEALERFDADWVVFLDADERIDLEDGTALKRFVEEEAIPGFVFGFQVFRLIEDAGEFDANSGLWVYRMFAYEPDLELASRRLHFVPVPVSIPRSRWIRTTFRIQHVGSMTESRRAERYQKYQEADPTAEYQDDYTNLLRPPENTQTWPRRPSDLPALVDHETQLAAIGSGEGLAGNPAISAVVISQNDEDTIARSVRAMVDQQVEGEFEVIVVTSGTDATAEIVDSQFPSVRLMELPRPVLPGEARNAGLWVARGEYITFPGSHVTLATGSLQARLDAHEAGWDLVTGTTLNGNDTRAGWASYFLDHSAVLPLRDSGDVGAPPAHCSYVRRDLDLVGGFPEDMRAGEDTVVNQELFRRGRRAYREQDAAIFHGSPSRTATALVRHHFVRGRAWGRILLSRSDSRGRLMRTRASVLLRMPLTRFRTVSRNVEIWGGDLQPRFKKVRGMVALGATAAGLGTWYEVLTGSTQLSPPSPAARLRLDHASPAKGTRVVAHYGSPYSTGLGILGMGPPGRAADRVARAVKGLERDVISALHVLATAATTMPGRDGSYSATLTDAELSSYLEAARRVGGLLILGIQPGWSSFRDAVLRHRSLIGESDVGIALEPGWRTLPPVVPGSRPGRWDVSEMEAALRIVQELSEDDHATMTLIHTTADTPWPNGWSPPELSRVDLVPLVDMVGEPREKLTALANVQERMGPAGLVWNYRRDTEIPLPEETLGHDLRPRIVVYR